MSDADLTLTSPVTCVLQGENPLLCLTIIWHPERERIGEQAIVTGQNLALSRYHPLFCQPEQLGLPLGHGGISRSPLEFSIDTQGGVTITVPVGRMQVELDGREVQSNQYLQPDQIGNGTILGLGRAVLLCLHWLTALPKNNAIDGLIGVGSSTQKVRDLIRQVAATDATVLLLGETGTGKEVVAQAIHSLSLRKQKSLISVNMAALNDDLAAADLFGAAKGAYTGAQNARNGFFQEAENATLFLDEIGNAPASVQPMLLRVLETGDYRPLGATKDLTTTARIIAATDQDLYGGGFNPALLRRLESFVINLPPLRNRREDLGVLIVHLMQSPALANIGGNNLSFTLLTQFATYDWPGNVRQLRHFLKRVLLGIAANEPPSFASLIDTPPQRIAGLSIAYHLRYQSDREDELWQQKAFASAEQAMKLNSDLAISQIAYGHALLGRGNLDEALQASKRALSLDPNNIFSWLLKAKALNELGKANEAIQFSELALQRFPQCHIFADLIGTIYSDIPQLQRIHSQFHFLRL